MATAQATTQQSRLPWWARPALLLDRIRPGLAEQAAADAASITRLPRGVGLALPLLAVAIPIAFSVPHALAPSALNAVDFTFQILDVYQESLPFMMVAAALGLLAPTLGLLFVLVFLPADMVAALFQQGEMTPLPMAILARTLSCWVLYLLATELPMAAHDMADWAATRTRAAWGGVGAGALTAGALTWVWAMGAPVFIIPVFTWTAKIQPTTNAAYALNVHTPLFVVFGAMAVLAALGLRRVLRPAEAAPAPARTRSSLGPILFGIVVPLALFASVVTQPIDAVVLVAAVLGARPLSVLLLRRGPLAPMLAAIPRPVRFILGVASATAVSYLIVNVLGFSPISSFFTMVLALAASFLIMRILLDADDFTRADADVEPPSVAVGLSATLAIGGLVWLFAAAPVLADNLGSHPDGWGTAAAAAGAAAGGAALASGSAKNKKKEPNPPPWYVPNGFAEFFGYDSPYEKPPDANKPPPDPNQPPPGWPKQRK